jgi:dephospho-CoA kinase
MPGVLRVGLTGGIGAGKSTLARRLADLGGYVIDADQLAREVVAPGTEGLAAVVEAFGDRVLDPAGRLDRPALGRIVFADESARIRLNGLLHPRIAARTRELIAAAPPGAVIVHDVPLLVENAIGAGYHLVLVVHAPVEERVRRLVDGREMTVSDARARVAAQADDAARRLAADVWLDNSGAPADLLAAVDRLWTDRLVPFESNVRARRPAARPEQVRVVEPDPAWPAEAARLMARVRAAAGDRMLALDHVGSTAVPGLAAKDVIDLQLVVADLVAADAVAGPLAAAGFARPDGEWWDDTSDGGTHPKRLHVACDPGRAANLHVREAASAAVAEQLTFRDWLRAHDAERDAYAAVKRTAAEPDGVGGVGIEAYQAAKGPWVRAALLRALARAPDSPPGALP